MREELTEEMITALVAYRLERAKDTVQEAVCINFHLYLRYRWHTATHFFLLAEREGFEPPEARTSTVFKTAAIDHSAISP